MPRFEVEIVVSEYVTYEVGIEAESADEAFSLAKAKYDKSPRLVVQDGYEIERELDTVVDYYAGS